MANSSHLPKVTAESCCNWPDTADRSMRCTTVLAVFPARTKRLMFSAYMESTAASAHPLQVTHGTFSHSPAGLRLPSFCSSVASYVLHSGFFSFWGSVVFPLSEKRVGWIRTRTSHLISRSSTRSLDGLFSAQRQKFQVHGAGRRDRRFLRCMCMQIDERPAPASRQMPF